jgi:hypothetical protein
MVSSTVSSRSREKVLGGLRIGRILFTAIGGNSGYVVDGGKARIILNALVTPFEVTENQPMLDLLWRTSFRWKLHPRQLTGDTA